MKMNFIINRYILKEMLTPFSISVLFFAIVFIMMEMLKITNWVVNYNINIWVDSDPDDRLCLSLLIGIRPAHVHYDGNFADIFTFIQ